mgnify:CR=1 FL=1
MSDHLNALPANESAAQVPSESSVMTERRAKLDALRTIGPAFPNDIAPTHAAAKLNLQYALVSREQLEAEPVEVSIAGRMILKRVQGKASFATLQDGSHRLDHPEADGRFQLWMNDEGIGATSHEAFKHWDLSLIHI